jgi:hypothetical protein
MLKKQFLLAIALITAILSFATATPMMAQVGSSPDVWRQVYQQLPDLPLENQYVNKESGKVDLDNTLVSRLIRYHIFVKGRPPNWRLDWKLTMADYLDANELMTEGVYPSADTLRDNPIDGDRAAIKRLTRNQRNALVQALVNAFNPNAETPATPTPTNTPPPQSTPNRRSIPRLPQPGDADRLRL